MKYTFQVLLENKLIFTFVISQEFFSPETWTLQGVKLNFFFLIATWLLNSSKWQPIQKKLVAIFKDKQNVVIYLPFVMLDRYH